MKKLIFLIISVILLTGCSTAIAKNNDVAETTKKQEAQNATKEVKQETTATDKQEKRYGLSDYKKYIESQYKGNVRIDGKFVLYDIYDEYDDNGNFIPGVVSRVGKYDILQLNETLRLKDSGEDLVKSFKSKVSANKKDSVIISYVLKTGQSVEIPEGSRPVIPEGYVGKYVVEMYVRGNSITSNLGGKTNLEQAQINNAYSQQIQAQRRAEADAKYEAKRESQEAAHEAYEQKEAEKRAEAQENAANTAAFKQIGNNAYQKLYSILSSYSSYSENIAGKDIGELMQGSQGMTKKDNSVKKISVGAYNYKIPIEVWPEACSECLAAIDESINELEGYTSGVKDSLAKTAQMVINDLNKVRAKFH